MRIENCGGTWAVVYGEEELRRMAQEGREPAEEAARSLGCGEGCRGSVYRGREGALLFLYEKGADAELLWFPDLEALLQAAVLLTGIGETDLYAPDFGFLLAFPPTAELPLRIWDLGRRVPRSAAEQAKLLLKGNAVETLSCVFRL